MDDTDRSVFAWLRRGRDSGAICLVIVNFTPEVQQRLSFAGSDGWRVARGVQQRFDTLRRQRRQQRGSL